MWVRGDGRPGGRGERFLALLVLAPLLAACSDSTGPPEPPTEPPRPIASEVEVRPSGAVVPDLGETVMLEAVARDAEGEELATEPSDFTWRSTNPVVATVDGTGTATAHATGQVTITAALGEATGHAVVTVNQPAPRSVVGWDRPVSPTTETLLDLWGSAPDDVWAVGFKGVILHYDGTEWSSVQSPTDTDLRGVWGSGPEDVWAVGGLSFRGGGLTLHFDGIEWSEVPNPAELGFADVWGSAPDDVWAVEFDRFFHFDGTEWTEVPSPVGRPISIWGSGPDDVWAVGGFFGNSHIAHFDGTEWVEVPNPGGCTLFSVWGSGPDDVWAVGDAGFLHFDGTSWTLAGETPTGERLMDVWGSGPNDAWVAAVPGIALHYDGTAWRGVGTPASGSLTGVWEMTPGDVWVAGLEGEMLLGRR